MKIYTRRGDDGTTGLLFGGRVAKDSPRPSAYGAVDEAQSFIGAARALVSPDAELDQILIAICRDLYIAMAELATSEENVRKLTDGATRVSSGMVTALEALIDDIGTRFDSPTEFVIPGGSQLAAALDVARTVVRRAERAALAASDESSLVVTYLNRLSDLLWVLARWQEDSSTLAREPHV